MFGYCLLKSELRIFNISRIVKLEILKKKYNLKEEILEEIYSKKEFFRFYCDDSVVLRYERDTFKFASLYFDDSDYDILDNDLYKNKILEMVI